MLLDGELVVLDSAGGRTSGCCSSGCTCGPRLLGFGNGSGVAVRVRRAGARRAPPPCRTALCRTVAGRVAEPVEVTR